MTNLHSILDTGMISAGVKPQRIYRKARIDKIPMHTSPANLLELIPAALDFRWADIIQCVITSSSEVVLWHFSRIFGRAEREITDPRKYRYKPPLARKKLPFGYGICVGYCPARQ